MKVVSRRRRGSCSAVISAVWLLAMVGEACSGMGEEYPSQRSSSPPGAAEASRYQRGWGIVINSNHGLDSGQRLSWPGVHRALVLYKQRFGHCDVPDDRGLLEQWVENQRVKRLPSAIWADRIQDLGFLLKLSDPKPRTGGSTSMDGRGMGNGARGCEAGQRGGPAIGGKGESWEARLADLLKFKSKYGHCDVPSKWQGCLQIQGARGRKTRATRRSTDTNSGTEKGKLSKLSVWVHNQRLLQHRGELLPSREGRLYAIGFNFRLRKRDDMVRGWYAHANDLAMFVQAAGSATPFPQVERVHGVPTHRVRMWLLQQRCLDRQGMLSISRRRWLQGLGVNMGEGRPGTWEWMYESLRAYKELHGTCDVPQQYEADRRLARWVNNQRCRRKQGSMPHVREAQLEELGFCWDVRKALPDNSKARKGSSVAMNATV